MVVPLIAHHLFLPVSQISRCGAFQYIRKLFGFLGLFYTFLESVLKEQEAANYESNLVCKWHLAAFDLCCCSES